MTELMAALAEAAEAAGCAVELALDRFPAYEDDRAYVVVPHEFDAWGLASGQPDAQQRARTIALCTENPGTTWFESTAALVTGLGCAVSINRSSAAELRRRGVRCEHLQLGYCARWDSWRRELHRERPIDVLYLGAADPRRDPLLAAIGARLWARECQFLVPPLEQRTAQRPDFLTGDEKYRRLAEARVLLNLHRTTSAALEWMRFLEAICNGCVVVSEPSLDGEPLLPGEHYVQAPAARIGASLEELLDDRPRLQELQRQAYDFIREQLPIEPAGTRLAELAGKLLQARASAPKALPGAGAARATAGEPPTDMEGAPVLAVTSVLAAGGGAGPGEREGQRRRRAGGLRSEIKGHIERARRRRAATPARTPCYDDARPRVSVIAVIAGNRAQSTIALLETVVDRASADLEVLALADGSDARGVARAHRFLDRHPALPILLLAGDQPELGTGRNVLVERARGRYVLALPGSGGIFPSTVERLARALEGDRDALFAYPMVAVVESGTVVQLRGALPWEPERLTRESWIDPPALIRRERLLELGGYATDARLRGLEDFELWCRCAENLGRGVHVPQVLAWHAPEDNAQPVDVAAVADLLRERCPRLFGAATR
jgi:hypothetical protein